jgi:hypothetical protein
METTGRREEGVYRNDDYVVGPADPELRRLRTISVLYQDIESEREDES